MNKKFFTFNSLHNDTHDNFSPNLPCTAYTSFDTISPQSSPYHDTDSLSDKSKKIRKKRNTYQKIDDETRRKLLDAVQQGDTLKAAAKRYGINYSSAKSILHTYRKEGRITKKSAQERTSRRRTKTSQDLEMSPIYPYNNPQDEFDGVHEASTYQTYHSPEKSDHTHGLSDGGSPKAGVSGLPVNSFGGFLKIGYRHKSDNTNNRLPTPGIMVKLESQRSQTLPSADFGHHVAQSRNWQVNFNVQNPQETYYYPERSRNQVKTENVQKECENYYINYANSPLAPVRQPKKEEQNVPKDYENFAENYAGMEDSQASFNAQSYDVSCFLSSSPAYAFQQKMNGMNQYRNPENFSAMESYRNVVDTQEMYYDGAKPSYMGDFRSKIEEGATGYITRAGLSSY